MNSKIASQEGDYEDDSKDEKEEDLKKGKASEGDPNVLKETLVAASLPGETAQTEHLGGQGAAGGG